MYLCPCQGLYWYYIIQNIPLLILPVPLLLPNQQDLRTCTLKSCRISHNVPPAADITISLR